MATSERIINFQNSIANVTALLRRSKYSPYIEFSVGNFRVSTQKNNNYFMQLNIQYTGAGSANTVGLEIAYVPKPGEDPNAIDKALDGAVAYKKPCYLRFGYSGSEMLLSPLYEFIITDYKISLRDNMIYYSLTVISTIAKLREYRTDFPLGRENMVEHTDEEGNIYYYSENIAEEVRRTFDEMFKDEGYKTILDEGVYTNASWTNLKPINNITVFQYANTLLSEIKDRESDTAVYWYSFEDAEGEKRIYIHRTLNQEDLLVKEKAETLFTFDWGGNPQNITRNTLVLTFENSFTGAVNIATKDSLYQDHYVINSSGESVKIKGLKSVDVGDYASNDSTIANRQWWKASAWVYDAQLEIVGIPADIPIGVLIRVRPLIYGREHHTAGVYMITGASSNITSNGFTTNLKLVKYISEDSVSELAQMVKKIRESVEEKERLWNSANPSPRYSTYNDYANRNEYVNIQSRDLYTNEAPETSESNVYIPDPEAEAEKAQAKFSTTATSAIPASRSKT